MIFLDNFFYLLQAFKFMVTFSRSHVWWLTTYLHLALLIFETNDKNHVFGPWAIWKKVKIYWWQDFLYSCKEVMNNKLKSSRKDLAGLGVKIRPSFLTNRLFKSDKPAQRLSKIEIFSSCWRLTINRKRLGNTGLK